MTAPTPEQMRALATELDALAMLTLGTALWHTVHEAKAALRAAADQLEAVERWLWMQNGHLPGVAIEELSAILNADTAPQENRDD